MTRYFPDAHFSDEHRALFAFASYNAGPSKIAKMRAEAAARGLDPAHPPNRHQSNWAPVLVRRLAVPTYRQPLGFEVCAADFDVNSKLTRRTQSPIGWSFFQPYVEEVFLISSSEKIHSVATMADATVRNKTQIGGLAAALSPHAQNATAGTVLRR